jgi:predicted ArsR family transcriptional regulator
MEQTLKITNVLADPTRFHIYEYIATNQKEVTVQDIADIFQIHPNVARMHLSKLEDVNLLVAVTNKTGKGGRPSRLYRLSDHVIQLHFPFRDYQLLAKISIQALENLGESGREALRQVGKQFGEETVKRELPSGQLSVEQKLNIISNTAKMIGLRYDFSETDDQTIVNFQILNCPFKEIASESQETVCYMHHAFIQGMFEALFSNVQLKEEQNLIKGCEYCAYQAIVTK